MGMWPRNIEEKRVRGRLGAQKKNLEVLIIVIMLEGECSSFKWVVDVDCFFMLSWY